jgi:hypothetical protein
VASQRSRDNGVLGADSTGAGRVPALAQTSRRHEPVAANDNEAPLFLKVRRLVLVATSGLAIGWLFWVGFLR